MSAPNADPKAILEKAESLIAQGKTKEALNLLTTLKEKSFRKNFVGLSNQYNTLEEQSRSGVLTNEEFLARKARVNASILSTIQQVETALKDNPLAGSTNSNRRLKLVLSIVLFGAFSFLAYQFIQPTDTAAPLVLDCPNGHKKAVKIAEFQQDATGGFSESLMAALQSELNPSIYNTSVENAEPVNSTSYHDTIQLKYFAQSCDTSGIFVNGRWDSQLKVFNCWIDLFYLQVKIPGLESNASIVLNNPPGISFSVREDSKFLADFILGILKTHEGESYEALQLFTKLEKDSIILSDEKLKGNLAYFKAIAYTSRGDEKRAREQFTVAALAAPNLKENALKNIEVAKQVAEVMDNDPELKPMLVKYLAQDSLLETQEKEETSPPSLLKNNNEPAVVKKVAEKMQDQAKQTPQQPEEQLVEEEEKKDPPKAFDINNVKTKRLAGKTWMTQNLNLEVADSWCYNDDPKNCQQYGRLYTWEAAKKACASLGSGWRLPTDEEWKTLANAFGGYDDNYGDVEGNPKKAYKALLKNGNSGFSALLGGFRNLNGEFSELGREGLYLSNTESWGGADQVWDYWFSSVSQNLIRADSFKSSGFSCRCIKD